MYCERHGIRMQNLKNQTVELGRFLPRKTIVVTVSLIDLLIIINFSGNVVALTINSSNWEIKIPCMCNCART